MKQEKLESPTHHRSTLMVEQNRKAMEHATEHCFERSSVVPKRKLLAEALKYGVGQVSVEGVTKELDIQDVIVRKLSNREMATTEKVLAEERVMLNFVRNGREKFTWHHSLPKSGTRNANGSTVIKAMLLLRCFESRKIRVVVIRGGAGTGKTSLMSEAVEAIENRRDSSVHVRTVCRSKSRRARQ